jgi:predicted TIM-barrel fold metal-dependent hydrolase
LENIFFTARQNDWPILTHTDQDGTSMSAICYEELARAFPDVVLILAHIRPGSIPIAKRYANVFVDTTYMEPWIVEVGVDALGAEKILFGSDAAEGFDVGHAVPRERPHRSHAALIQGLKDRGLPDPVLEKILFQNACDLFKIKKK